MSLGAPAVWRYCLPDGPPNSPVLGLACSLLSNKALSQFGGSDSTQLQQQQQMLQRFDQQEGAPWSQQQLRQPAPPCPRPAPRHEQGYPAHRLLQLRAVNTLRGWQGVCRACMHPASLFCALQHSKSISKGQQGQNACIGSLGAPLQRT
eukprot:1140855-Pelagomonas_calceolata.AAC.6